MKAAMALAKLTQNKQRVSQFFGKPLVIGGKNIYAPMKGHNGLDLATPVGTPLLATIEGTAEVINQGKSGYGLAVKIHKGRPDGISEVIYAHLSSTTVKTGDHVKLGGVIGFSGGDASSPTSGLSTGPHLHFGLRFRDVVSGKVLNADNGYAGWIDPVPYFEKGAL